MKEAIRKYGAYVLFALVVLVLFAWVRMPSEAVRSIVLSAVSKNQAGALVRFDSAELAFPFGVTLTGLIVQTKHGRGLRFEADTVTAHPALLSLLTGRLALRIQAASMGGRIDGDIAFRDRFSASGPVQADLTFGNINAADCPWIAELLGRAVRGRGGRPAPLRRTSGAVDFRVGAPGTGTCQRTDLSPGPFIRPGGDDLYKNGRQRGPRQRDPPGEPAPGGRRSPPGGVPRKYPPRRGLSPQPDRPPG